MVASSFCHDRKSAFRWGYITDKHRKAKTLSVMKRWKNCKFKRTVKERRYSDNKNAEKLDSKFENLDVNNSNPISPFKGCNIVDLGFVCQQLVEGCKACKTTLSFDTVLKRKSDWSCKHFVPQLPELQYSVTMVKTSTWHVNENTKDSRNACIYDVNTKCAAGTYTKFLL